MSNYTGIYQGIVVDRDDPKKLGRCRIKVPSVHGDINQSDYKLLPWAIYLSPNSAGNDRTTFILPKLNDIVWVAFVNGDKQSPIYFGSNFAVVKGIKETPVSDDEYYTTDVVYSSGDGAKLKKNEEEIRLEYNDSYISITNSGDINIKASGTITINGIKVNIN